MSETTEKIVFRYGKPIFKGEDGFSICVARLRSDSSNIIVKGYDIPKTKNCWVIASGKWVADAKHGKSFSALYSEVETPKTEKGIVSYLKSMKVGLGDKYAQKIFDRFGASIWTVLDTKPEEIEEIEGISSRSVKRLRKKWEEISIKRNLMQLFSESTEFTGRMAEKVAKKLGAEAVVKVQKNPYLLCRMAGLSFKVVDRVAKEIMKEKANPYTKERTGAAFFSILKQATVSGHVCLPEQLLVRNAMTLLNSAAYTEKLLERQVRNALTLLVKKGWLKKSGITIYSVRSWEDEKRLSDNIIRLIRAGAEGTEYATLIVDDVLKSYMEQNSIALAERQCKAVQAAFLEPVSIVTGGPGTGKTTLTKAILRLDKEIHGSDSDPVLLAPTGRAARRLAEATCHPASTVHSAIGYKGEDMEYDDEDEKQLNASIVIVDEASMLDQRIASLLVEKIADGTRVVFVGDSDQLPSVGAGNVLAELIVSGVVPVTRLEVVFRQTGEHNPILINSDKIHKGETDLVYDKDFRFIECHKEDAQIYHACMEYLRAVKKYGIDNVMLLNPYRTEKKTKVNADRMNKQIQMWYNPPKNTDPQMIIGKTVFSCNDRVMQTKNTEMAQNGDIGTVTRIFDRENEDDPTQMDTIMEVDFSGMRVEYTKEEAQDLTLAYCCTVHKSQGAEYKMVIMVVSNFHTAMLQRNLIYTGITRARQQVMLIGNIQGEDSAVTKAIKNTKSATRYTNLANRLRETAQEPKKADNIADIT